jgi:hypothetical protein
MAMLCRPSISCGDHPIAPYIGFDVPPSCIAGWWPNGGNLDSTTCYGESLGMRKIMHIDLPNAFSISAQERQSLGWKSPKNESRPR